MEPRLKTPDLSIFNTPEGRLRLLSALLLAPVVLGVIYLGGASFAGLVAVANTAALFEWLRLVDPESPASERYGLYSCLVLAVLLAAAGLPMFGLIVVVMATAAFYAHRSNINPAKAVWFAAGLPYLAFSAVALVYLRDLPGTGFVTMLYLIACVWGMDIGAYVTGRLIGGPKMAPAISPNKTWSGLIGGLVLAMLLSGGVLFLSHSQKLFRGLFIALSLGLVAQLGDLFKSFFKRRAGVKDCGNLIPGHGGVLDRIDGLVFAAMLLAVLQTFFGPDLLW